MRQHLNTGRAVTVALAVAVAAGLSGCGPATTATDAAPATTATDAAAEAASLVTYTCPQLATEAAALSKGEKPELIKVRAPKVLKDNRKTYTKPTGDKEALVMSCNGTGVWSDGTNTPVLLKLSVDADNASFVSYEGQ